MDDELLARLQANCAHDWQYVAGIGRQCQKCSLLWETWAERRIALLESYFEDEDEKEEEGDIVLTSVAVFMLTLLPPQTEYTCPHCDGTGQEPFGAAVALCIICSVQYDPDDVYQLSPKQTLPCGHSLDAIRLVSECVRCHGSGIRQ